MSLKRLLSSATAVATAAALLVPSTAQADPREVTKEPVSTGYGGAVSTVDPSATEAGLKVLRSGGNAVDAAVAAAAALGVTEPFSSGVGGGGFFVYYDASSGKVHTIDGREEAPAAMPRDAFVDPATGEPYPFYPERVTGGVSVGVPGTLATWQRALDLWGTVGLKRAFRHQDRRPGFRGRPDVPRPDRAERTAVLALPREPGAVAAGGRTSRGRLDLP